MCFPEDISFGGEPVAPENPARSVVSVSTQTEVSESISLSELNTKDTDFIVIDVEDF